MRQTDSLGRSTFYNIAPQGRVTPTDREVRWLKHIERHGPQSSQYLFELTRDTHRCKDTSLRQMRKLRAGGYLMLPRQQRATEHADFNPYIYDLTKAGKDHLINLGIDELTVRPTGHWWHGYTVSSATSSIDIAAARTGVRYIPTHEILSKKNAPLAIPLGQSKLIPDQLFAIDYGGSYRVIALEVDRGTEPKTSSTARKSYARSIEQYRQIIEGGIYRAHYGLKANLVVLWVFTRRANQQRFLDLVVNHTPSIAPSILTQSLPIESEAAIGSKLLSNLYAAPWHRVKLSSVDLSIG